MGKREPALELCNVWFNVDYGEGPVRVRCTKMGAHDDHESLVVRPADQDIEVPLKHNVFDND